MSRLPLLIWFYIVLLSVLRQLFFGTRQLQQIAILQAMAYLCSVELLGRMVSANPFIPHELSKYLLIFLACWGILTTPGKKGRIGVILLLLLLPACFLDMSGKVSGLGVFVFNVFGPVSLALLVAFTAHLSCTQENLLRILRLSLYFPLSVLSYCYIKTPDFEEMNFRLGANFDASGGYGANQVSTVLGLGLFLTFLFWLSRWKLTGYRWLDILLCFGFAFQGLLTFSRGGMLGGALAIGILFLVVSFTRWRNFEGLRLIKHIRRYALPALLIIGVFYFIADNVTEGRLSMRYSGQTEGTLISGERISFNKLTTGRYDIFLGDIDLWLANPLFGVGVGASSYMRTTMNGVIAHVELSRLLAEHGISGLLFFFILVTLPWRILLINKDPINRAILLSLFGLAIFTSFHAAMRTYITPLFVGISLLNIKNFSK